MNSGIVCRNCGCPRENAPIFCSQTRKYHDYDYVQPKPKIPLAADYEKHHTPMPPLPAERSKMTEKTAENKAAGLKYDAGKPLMSLIPYGPIAWMARAMEQGLYKYLRGNWQQLTGEANRHRIEDALLRHAMKLSSGEWTDQESKLPHAAHIMCNAAFLLFHRDALDGTSPDVLNEEQRAAMLEAKRIGEANRTKALAEAKGNASP